MARAAGCFAFLELPTEVRLIIYRFLLPHSEYQSVLKTARGDCPIVWYPGTSSSILFANRRIYEEASEILYSENSFSIYVRHPRQPRLPMNESRADPETFLLISWAKRTWSHPKNPRIPYSILENHYNLRDVRHVHISLPPFDDLLGVDVAFLKVSHASLHGINAWMKKCTEIGACIDDHERNRMDYVQQIKGPIDEVGALLNKLPQIDILYVSLQTPEREVTFVEYLLERILTLQNVNRAQGFYSPKYLSNRRNPRNWATPDYDLVERLSAWQGGPSNDEYISHLPKQVRDMYRSVESFIEIFPNVLLL